MNALSSPLPEIRDGVRFNVLGDAFVVTQVIGQTCYVKRDGARCDKAFPVPELQRMLVLAGVEVAAA